MKDNLRWYDVDKDTVQARNLKEAQRIVEQVKAYKKGVEHEIRGTIKKLSQKT